MIRVLQVLGGTNLGGAESRIMDIYRHMDRSRIQFDFLVTEGNSGYFTPEIESLGGHVYTIPRYRIYNHMQYVAGVKAFFEQHHDYMAVHGHMTSTAAIYLPIAKAAGIPLTIAHARSAGVDSGIKGKLTNILRKPLPQKCDKMIACSDLAACAVFGENNYNDGLVKILPNAIDVSDYRFSGELRDEIRRQYGIEDRFVIGHVGRFHEAKNHKFLLDVWAEFLELRQDAVLMIVGDGGMRTQIEQWIDQLDEQRMAQGKASVKDKIILTGNQNPVAPYYMAFDIFLFPSFYEGMPGTVVEAQASGLHSLIADTITRMVKVTDLVDFYSLRENAKAWAAKLYSIAGQLPTDSLTSERNYSNGAVTALLMDSDYNVEKQIEYYSDLYEKGLEENLLQEVG